MSRKASGLKAWFVQRVTATYIALFSIYLLIKLSIGAPAGFAEWKAWLGDPLVSVLALLFFVTVLMHAWIGVRDILIDYVWNTGQRMVALSIVGLALIACGLWAAQILILARI